MKSITKKIILTGSFSVGKTSLISRFVYQSFSAEYKTTLGVKIDRKTVELDNCIVNMMIWDIGGEQKQARVPETYFLGSGGVIYVFDISRPSGFSQITEDIAYLTAKLKDVPVVVVGNKIDLLDVVTLEEVKQIIPVSVDFYTSAKEGTNVENVFTHLAQKMVNES
ncbi:GTP-binding protein [Sphingobacteriales bacterium UPWRP_1]|nr:GTP-binding protein [Sphingobacteriales bacterium TSM_CSM]PSJ78130.1 GTP-binding protein [Sphingobacteriales bacterium UPWRP_1]